MREWPGQASRLARARRGKCLGLPVDGPPPQERGPGAGELKLPAGSMTACTCSSVPCCCLPRRAAGRAGHLGFVVPAIAGAAHRHRHRHARQQRHVLLADGPGPLRPDGPQRRLEDVMRRRGWIPVAARRPSPSASRCSFGSGTPSRPGSSASTTRPSTLSSAWWPTAKSTPAPTSPPGWSSRGLSPRGDLRRNRPAPPAELVLPEWIHEWRENNALPSTRRPAPHRWVR